jgi:hypothetical protein
MCKDLPCKLECARICHAIRPGFRWHCDLRAHMCRGGYHTPAISRPSQPSPRQSGSRDWVGRGDRRPGCSRAEKVTAVLIKRCRTMLTERCRISPNNEVANSIMCLSTDQPLVSLRDAVPACKCHVSHSSISGIYFRVRRRPSLRTNRECNGPTRPNVRQRGCPQERGTVCPVLGRAQRCKRGHPSGALILKPCKFAVQPVCDRRATADRQGARHMYTRSRA